MAGTRLSGRQALAPNTAIDEVIVFPNPAQCEEASRYNRKYPVHVLRGSLKPRPRQVSADQGKTIVAKDFMGGT